MIEIHCKRRLGGPLRAAAVIALLAAIGPGAAPARAGGDDPSGRQGTFRHHCADCHASPEALAQERLDVVDGILRGRDSGRDIRAFLAGHHPPPRRGQIDAMLRLLRRHAEANGPFQRQCAICHGHARELARLELTIADGRLRGLYSRRDVREFLDGHARLDTAGAAFFTDLLFRMTQDAKPHRP